MVYAVVRAGGRQEKVEVGTIVTLDRQKAKQGESIELTALLLVDGDAVTTDAEKLAKVTSPPRCSASCAVPRSSSRSSRTRPATRSARATVRT